MAWNLGAIIARFRVDTTGWSRGTKTVKDDIRFLGREMVVLGTTITGFATLTVREFGKFDQAIREALAVSDVTTEQFDQMSRMAEDMSVQLNKAATETAKGFYYLGSAGLSATEQMQSFAAVNKLARATTIEVGDAAEGLVDIMKAFNITFEHSETVANMLVKTIITSNQVFSELRKSMSYVSSTAELANNEIYEIAAMLGVMANAGIKGSYAGTGLRRSLTNLISPTAEMTRRLRELNVTIYDSAGRMKPYMHIMGELSDALKKYGDEYKGTTFKILFGVRAIAGQIKLFDMGKKELVKYANEIKNSGETMDMVVKKQMAAFLHQLGRVWRWVQTVARSLGETLVPNIRGLIDIAVPFLSTLDKWIDANKELVVSTMKFATLAGVLSLTLGTIMLLLPTLVTSFWMLVGAVSSIGIPILVAVAGFYALRVVWAESFKKMREITNSFGSKFDEFVADMAIVWTEMWNVMGYTFVEFFNRVMTGYAKIGAAVMYLTKVITSFWRKMTTEEKAYIKELEGFLTDPTIMEFWEPFKAGIIDVSTAMGKLVKQDLEALKLKLMEVAPELVAFINKIRGLIFGPGVTPELPGIPGLPGADALTRAGEETLTTWQSVTRGIITEFRNMSELITESMNDMVNSWEDSLGEFLQVSGNFGDKLINLMDNIFDAVYQSFVQMLSRMIAQQMFWRIFGEGWLPMEPKAGWISGQAPGAAATAADTLHPSYRGEYTNIMRPPPSTDLAIPRKIAINLINQTGIPIQAEPATVRIDGDKMVIDAVFRGLETNARLRTAIANRD